MTNRTFSTKAYDVRYYATDEGHAEFEDPRDAEEAAFDRAAAKQCPACAEEER